MTMHNYILRLILQKGARLFTALLILAATLTPLLHTTPVSADTGGYPWYDATTLSASTYDWGYSTCPASDSGCLNYTGFKYTVNNITYGEADPWIYYLRNCTSYMAWQINQQFGVSIQGWGNATDWDTSATAHGYTVSPGLNHTPVAGEIAQWEGTTSVPQGHVAYVLSVTNGIATLGEYNDPGGSGTYLGTQTTASNSLGTPDHYIHIGTATTTTSTLRSIPSSDGHIQLFKTSNGVLSENWYSPSAGTVGAWTQPVAMPAQPSGTPAVAARSGQQVIDVFVLGSDSHIYETWYNWATGGWGGWINMGGTVTSDPQILATSDGHYQVFGTGNNLVQQNWFSPSGTYGGWVTSVGLAANAVGSPALVARSGQTVIDEFVRGGNSQIYETWYNWATGGWGGWIGMGGAVTSDPQTQPTSDGHDQVFGTSNSLVQQNWFSPTGTIGGWISF